MGSTTSRFSLYKPDPSENVDVNAHINANYDKIDAAAKNSDLTSQVSSLQSQIDAIYTNIYGASSRRKLPACKISIQANQSTLDGNWATLNFASPANWENDGVQSNFGTNSIKITFDGIYLCVAQVTWVSSFSNGGLVAIQNNGVTRGMNKGFSGGATGPDTSVTCSFLGNFSANDLVTVQARQDSGGPVQLKSAAPGCSLAVVYIGRIV